MATITTQGTVNPDAEQTKIEELRNNPAANAAELLGQAVVQEAIGKMPAPPPARSDNGESRVDDVEGAVKTDPKTGRKTLADGRVIHHGSTMARSKVEIAEGQTPYGAVLAAVPQGGQVRSVVDESGETVAYRVIDPEDTISSFIWPNEDGDELEVSGPLAKRVGKLVK